MSLPSQDMINGLITCTMFSQRWNPQSSNQASRYRSTWFAPPAGSFSQLMVLPDAGALWCTPLAGNKTCYLPVQGVPRISKIAQRDLIRDFTIVPPAMHMTCGMARSVIVGIPRCLYFNGTLGLR